MEDSVMHGLWPIDDDVGILGGATIDNVDARLRVVEDRTADIGDIASRAQRTEKTVAEANACIEKLREALLFMADANARNTDALTQTIHLLNKTVLDQQSALDEMKTLLTRIQEHVFAK